MNRLFNTYDEFYLDLETARSKLIRASESISSNDMVIGSTLPSFRNHLKDTYSRIDNGFSSVSSLIIKYLAHSLIGSSVDRAVEKLSFIDLSTVLIQVPTGFNGNLYSYTAIISKIYPNVVSKAIELSNNLIMELGKIINIKSEKLSSRDLTSAYEPYEVLREDAAKVLNEYYENGRTQTRVALGNVFQSKNEISMCFQTVSDLEKSIKATNVHILLDQINHLSDLLKTIEDQIKIDTGSKFSPQVIRLLADGTHECARYYEFVSTLFYDCDVLIECIQQLSKKIKNL